MTGREDRITPYGNFRRSNETASRFGDSFVVSAPTSPDYSRFVQQIRRSHDLVEASPHLFPPLSQEEEEDMLHSNEIARMRHERFWPGTYNETGSIPEEQTERMEARRAELEAAQTLPLKRLNFHTIRT